MTHHESHKWNGDTKENECHLVCAMMLSVAYNSDFIWGYII